jgi:hypothetical protein
MATVLKSYKVVGQYKAIEIKEGIDGVGHARVLHPSRIEQEKDGSNQTIIQTDISGEADEIKTLCNAEWTDEVKTSWETFLRN